MKDKIETRMRALRDAVEHARSMPMSASVVLNRAELLELVEGLEAAIDDALGEASTVIGDRAAVIARGQEEADEIVRRAHAERDKLVSDTDVYRLASDRAEEVAAEAQRDAETLRTETEEYIESRLANFELTLERTLEAVRRGRRRLSDDSDVDSLQLPRHLER